MSSIHTRVRKAGFTLIEVVMVVAIVGILAALAFPAYLSRTMKANRVEAKTTLLGVAAQQERFFLKNNRFASSLEDLDANETLGMNGSATQNGFYTVSISVDDEDAASTFVVEAEIPSDGPQSRDKKCKSFQINQVGQRTSTDTADNDTTDICWR